MGRLSPENAGGHWRRGATGPAPGARFRGNTRQGWRRWSTAVVVTEAEPGRRFAFDVDRYGFGLPLLPVSVATWEYHFEPVDEGTLVTEVWTDGRRRWPDLLADRFDKLATGGRTFAEFQKRNIARTLARLKQDFESR
jgi:hypothetical protein